MTASSHSFAALCIRTNRRISAEITERSAQAFPCRLQSEVEREGDEDQRGDRSSDDDR